MMRIVALFLAVVALVSAQPGEHGPDHPPVPPPNPHTFACPIESYPAPALPASNDNCTICNPQATPATCPPSVFLSELNSFWECKYYALKTQLTQMLGLVNVFADVPPAVFAAHPSLAPLPQCFNPVLTIPSPTAQNPYSVIYNSTTKLGQLIQSINANVGHLSNDELVRKSWCGFSSIAASTHPALFTNYNLFASSATQTIPPLIHNQAGGISLSLFHIYQSLNEYLLIFSNPVGNGGYGGRYLATTFVDYILDGSILHRHETDVTSVLNDKGSQYTTTTGDFNPNMLATEYTCPVAQPAGSNEGGCLVLEYAHFPPSALPNMLDFGIFAPTENVSRDFKGGYLALVQATNQIAANCYPNGFPTAQQIAAILASLPSNSP